MEEKFNSALSFSQQGEYIKAVSEIIKDKYTKPPLAMVVPYGCQQNVSDSERLKGILAEIGFEFTDNADEADLMLYKTCAVREHAEDRVFGNIGALKHYKRRNPELIIGICGCMVQQEAVADRFKKSYPYVDLLFGTHVEYRLPEFLYRLYTTKGRVFEIDDSEHEIVEGIPIRRDGTFKGWLPIMHGCNNFCTYCIVPYVRGREHSRNYTEILKEAKEMISAGFKDITLLGQNVNSYNSPEKDLDGNVVDFPKLLRMINALEGDFRIRFMTSHPKDCSAELLYTMSECPKVSKHLHLPFQSGNNRVLKAMNRRYTVEKYLSLIELARKLMPDISITSDVIVGFPSETYEEFCDTLSLVKEVRFSALFTFIYSKRGGTPAAEMEDPVSRKEKGEWFRELLNLQEKVSKENDLKMANKTYQLLVSDYGREEGFMAGNTDGNICLEFPGDGSLIGEFVTVETYMENNSLKAKIKEQ